MYYKEYLPRSGLEAIKSLMKGDRGTRARIQGELLHQHGFQVPASLCWGAFVDRAFVIFDGLAAEPVGHYVKVSWGVSLSISGLKLKHHYLKALAEEVGRMHLCGIVHGDLRLNNILLDAKSSDIPVFYFIDNERNQHYQIIPRKLVVKNLVQLNLISPKIVSFNDRLRFFHTYNAVYLRFSDNEQKELVSLIWQMTLKRFKRPSLRDCYEDLIELGRL